ncbi:unnamed protein product [Meganyctiphanes norvegica]|uniref:DDE-1 domain-containing protein n=1 Tax=Meganyctiphanes norvegica TaxID=48144 RepID=A0AAV2PU36_MEGNR
MTSELFTDYFNHVIVPNIKDKFPEQRVIVTMDNTTCYPTSLNTIDEHIDVKFLPPNITSLIQPCGQQVIFSLKNRQRNVYYTAVKSILRFLKVAVCDPGKCLKGILMTFNLYFHFF